MEPEVDFSIADTHDIAGLDAKQEKINRLNDMMDEVGMSDDDRQLLSETILSSLHTDPLVDGLEDE